MVRSRSEQRRLERRAKAVRRAIDRREARLHRRSPFDREQRAAFQILAGAATLLAAIIAIALFGR